MDASAPQVRVTGLRVVAFKLVFSATALLGGLFAFHYAKFGYAQCHPTRTVVSTPERQAAKAELPNLEEASFETRDGLSLRAWFAPPENGVAVILVHGLGGNRASLLPEAKIFARHGYGVMLYDSRASGESGGTVATWGSEEAFDVASAIRFARQHSGVSQIALLGFSVGASAVARAAADDPTIAAVIFYAVWTSLREEIAYKTAQGGWLAAQCALLAFRASGSHIDAIHPQAELLRIAPRPVLMISGALDSDTPPWVMDRMFASTLGQKQFWRLSGVAHGGYAEAAAAEYERRVIAFLDGVFAPSRAHLSQPNPIH